MSLIGSNHTLRMDPIPVRGAETESITSAGSLPGEINLNKLQVNLTGIQAELQSYQTLRNRINKPKTQEVPLRKTTFVDGREIEVLIKYQLEPVLEIGTDTVFLNAFIAQIRENLSPLVKEIEHEAVFTNLTKDTQKTLTDAIDSDWTVNVTRLKYNNPLFGKRKVIEETEISFYAENFDKKLAALIEAMDALISNCGDYDSLSLYSTFQPPHSARSVSQLSDLDAASKATTLPPAPSIAPSDAPALSFSDLPPPPPMPASAFTPLTATPVSPAATPLPTPPTPLASSPATPTSINGSREEGDGFITPAEDNLSMIQKFGEAPAAPPPPPMPAQLPAVAEGVLKPAPITPANSKQDLLASIRSHEGVNALKSTKQGTPAAKAASPTQGDKSLENALIGKLSQIAAVVRPSSTTSVWSTTESDV